MLYGVHSQQQSCRALEKSFPLLQGLLSLVRSVFSKHLLLWSFSAYIYRALVSDKKSRVTTDSACKCSSSAPAALWWPPQLSVCVAGVVSVSSD